LGRTLFVIKNLDCESSTGESLQGGKGKQGGKNFVGKILLFEYSLTENAILEVGGEGIIREGST